ncbi:LysM peptidoglycan-binding domain-containing protein [Oceanitalea stevensii]|uniref:LysM peptidoglycan-binding domain-containing protein n=1 Tax=Oceanitalea stevensii TaxID=2763072 RepID=A0ABR8Z400_9MICO|nr:LysM peptidoglycan-binding domain-containing protein [Oceanitalea stevensii]MBD8063049.1 LysM peptidoglycan-binding domain-containing protein [Oceanitalea stevensii]
MLRTAALAAVALVASALLGRWSVELGSRGVARVDEAVALGSAAGGTLVAAWYALTAIALLLAQLAELGRRAPRLARGLRAAVGVAGAPVLRRAAVLGVGAGLALAAVPASAGPAADDTVPHDLRPGVGSLSVPRTAPPEELPGAEEPAQGAASAPEPSAPADEGPAGPPSTPSPRPDVPSSGAPPQDRGPAAPSDDRETAVPSSEQGTAALPTVAAVSGTGTPADTPTARPHAAAGSEAHRGTARHVVERGDSLWSIAKAHLGEGATDAEIAAEWPRWHTTNRSVIGADPHLIHPGQALLAPDPEEQR